MIHESYPWKQDLMRRKRLLQKYNTSERLNSNYEATCTVIEKAIFYSAFIVRKLIDCIEKLSDEADNYRICVKSIKPLKRIDLRHRWPEECSHDWENEANQIVPGKDVCNWLIHSYIFFLESEDEYGPLLSFCVSSDYDHNKVLYRVSIDDWIDYIDFVASDSVVSASLHYDEISNEYLIKYKERG